MRFNQSVMGLSEPHPVGHHEPPLAGQGAARAAAAALAA